MDSPKSPFDDPDSSAANRPASATGVFGTVSAPRGLLIGESAQAHDEEQARDQVGQRTYGGDHRGTTS